MRKQDDADRDRRERILEEANIAWARMMEDPETRAHFEAEDALWDATVGDGLEEEEPYD